MADNFDNEARPYLEDSYRLEFKARVIERRELADGGVGLVLDRTYFYPTSGGQPHDTGSVNGVRVLDVAEDPRGRVVHRLETDPGAEHVRGVVDAERRRDHMQQHSGQHLLSATCVVLLRRETLSFHLGAERCSIDLPGAVLTLEELDRLERRANEIVWEGRPVRARHLGRDELARLRKSPPEGVDVVRVVEIEGWDLNACCGTHVRRTSEIGLIKLLGQERVRDQTRLHFVCGRRALEECARGLRRQDELVRLLTCHPDELSAKVERQLSDLKSLRKASESLRRQVAATRAAAWAASAPRAGEVPVVVRRLEDPDPAALRATAEAIVARGGLALLGIAAARAQVLFMCPDDLQVDLRSAMRAAGEVLGGRGGGPPHRVQGAGSRCDSLPEALRAARDDVLRQLEIDPTNFDKRSSGG
ncbi:MAG: DHHA1 domain-containing protein [Candidatus Krumholzibacteriia bacterium]